MQGSDTPDEFDSADEDIQISIASNTDNKNETVAHDLDSSAIFSEDESQLNSLIKKGNNKIQLKSG